MGVKRIWWRNLWREIPTVIKVTVSLKQRHFSLQQLQCTFYNPQCYVFTFKMSTQKIGKWHFHSYRRSFRSSTCPVTILFYDAWRNWDVHRHFRVAPQPQLPPPHLSVPQAIGDTGKKHQNLRVCASVGPFHHVQISKILQSYPLTYGN
jgi:hypothetical protein